MLELNLSSVELLHCSICNTHNHTSPQATNPFRRNNIIIANYIVGKKISFKTVCNQTENFIEFLP